MHPENALPLKGFINRERLYAAIDAGLDDIEAMVVDAGVLRQLERQVDNGEPRTTDHITRMYALVQLQRMIDVVGSVAGALIEPGMPVELSVATWQNRDHGQAYERLMATDAEAA